MENDHAGPAAEPPRREESEQASAWPGVCRRWPAEGKCPRPGSAHGVPGVQTPQPSAPHKAGAPSRSGRADTTDPQPLPPASPPSPASPSCWGPLAAPPPPGPCLGLCPPSLGHAPRSGPLCRKRSTPGVRSGESAGPKASPPGPSRNPQFQAPTEPEPTEGSEEPGQTDAGRQVPVPVLLSATLGACPLTVPSQRGWHISEEQKRKSGPCTPSSPYLPQPEPSPHSGSAPG